MAMAATPNDEDTKLFGYRQDVPGRPESEAVKAYYLFRSVRKKSWKADSVELCEELPFAVDWIREAAIMNPKTSAPKLLKQVEAWEEKYDWDDADPFTFFEDIKYKNRAKFIEIFFILNKFYDKIQVNNTMMVSTQDEDESTNFRGWSEQDKTNLWKPGQVTEILGRNGTGKTNLGVGIVEDATRRESKDRNPIVVLSNIGFYKHVHKPKDKGGWGVKRVFNFNQVLSIIAQSFIDGIRATFILIIDEWDNTVNAGTAIKGTTRLFIQLYFQIRKIGLALITILHYEDDSNKRIRGKSERDSNAYCVINKGYFYQGRDDELNMGVKLEIEDSLTIAPIWKENGTRNLRYIPDYGDEFDTNRNTAFEINPYYDYGELFKRIGKLPPINNTPAARKKELKAKGHIIKGWLKECKERMIEAMSEQENPKEKFDEKLKETKEVYKNKLSELQREKLRNEYIIIREWKKKHTWDGVRELYVREKKRQITTHGLERRYSKLKEEFET